MLTEGIISYCLLSNDSMCLKSVVFFHCNLNTETLETCRIGAKQEIRMKSSINWTRLWIKWHVLHDNKMCIALKANWKSVHLLQKKKICISHILYYKGTINRGQQKIELLKGGQTTACSTTTTQLHVRLIWDHGKKKYESNCHYIYCRKSLF